MYSSIVASVSAQIGQVGSCSPASFCARVSAWCCAYIDAVSSLRSMRRRQFSWGWYVMVWRSIALHVVLENVNSPLYVMCYTPAVLRSKSR